ncbi:ankyrin repeat domain-containing protein 10-like isoform X2 [Mercenaria mercenaria]|uniref:ankyrin repeat domain-containing protein 10-like isoform X2 n=1 Tax=Mercenaria mercenaria TaxID=6596 RepID=UPI00234EFC61|nr:ankyrin repeat domain-containing protein 10-like isoform X2 [Mercenaria mercenaria]
MSHDDGNWTPASEDYLRRSFPVHRACRDGDIEQLASLLSAGDFDLYEEDDFYGWSPVHWAAYFGKLQCLTLLLQRGGNCDAPTERLNQTPSHIAAYGGYCHCLKWLLHCGATINRQDYMGETPIHKAARTGSMECVSLLVSQGAKLELKNYSGCLPSEVAAAAGYTECASYLERATQLQKENQPATNPANIGTNSSFSSFHNGRTSPEGQSSGQNFISTNTYHSHPHVAINGTPHHTHIENGLNNNQSEDCDMEMEEGSQEFSQSAMSNGVSPALQNGDVLLNHGVLQNLIPLAGRKRGREDVDEDSYKRARQDDFVFRQSVQHDFAQLPFAHGFDAAPSMDCNENMAPPRSNEHLNSAFQNPQNSSGFTVVCDPSWGHEAGMADRGHLGEINQNRVEPFSCLRFKDPPVKCINFMSHYI